MNIDIKNKKTVQNRLKTGKMEKMTLDQYRNWKNLHSDQGKVRIPKLPSTNVSKEKSWLDWNLAFFAKERGIRLSKEVTFDLEKKRRYRFDYCFPEVMLAVEYEGLFGGNKGGTGKSGHLTPKGYSDNCDKYNLATVQGWKVLRYTPMNYKNVLQDLKNLIINQ